MMRMSIPDPLSLVLCERYLTLNEVLADKSDAEKP